MWWPYQHLIACGRGEIVQELCKADAKTGRNRLRYASRSGDLLKRYVSEALSAAMRQVSPAS